MNYLFATVLALAGVGILIRNKTLAERLGAFYARRYSATFGKSARFLGLDNPNTSLNKFMYRGFIITAGIILLIFALAAFMGTNFVGPSAETVVSTGAILRGE